MSWGYPEDKLENKNVEHVTKVMYEITNTKIKEKTLQMGESLMLKTVMVKYEK